MLNSTPKLIVECAGSFKVNVKPGGRVEIEMEQVSGVSSDSDTLYDKAGVAKRLGTCARSIENWMTQKKHPLPYIKNCGHPKFRESDIIWWLDQGCSVAARRASLVKGCNILTT